MSYVILSAGNGNIVGTTSPLIKRADREVFADAHALLRRASAIADEAYKTAEIARQEAAEQGYAEGAAKAEAELKTALRRFADATAQIEELYSQQVAEAAYAATTAIIGELDDEQLVKRLVAQVLVKQKEQQGLSVQVSPDVQPKLDGLFDSDEGDNIAVVANPELGPTECHIMTANGRIIASLPVQLAVLRERWGLGEAGAEE
jgi:flagellar biosynthesis/type III secretory pathway protein FliH